MSTSQTAINEELVRRINNDDWDSVAGLLDAAIIARGAELFDEYVWDVLLNPYGVQTSPIESWQQRAMERYTAMLVSGEITNV